MRDGVVAKRERSKSMILFGLLKGTTMLSVRLFYKFASPNINMTSGGIQSGRVTKKSVLKIAPLKIQSFQIWMQRLVSMLKEVCLTKGRKKRVDRVQTKFRKETLSKASLMLTQRLTGIM